MSPPALHLAPSPSEPPSSASAPPARSTPVPRGNASGVQARVQPLPEPGEVLGRYRIVRAIGAGGMGTVFEAEHIVLEKRVALKVLKPELAVHEELRKRFVREGLSASRVRHPHVVDVTDAADENGRAYLVMELLEGRSLYEELVEHGPFDVETTLEMVLPICSALAVAHAVGVVHRDVKPENVFLVQGPGNRVIPKLVDFGISDTIDATRDENAELMGTPHYMAPEQVLGHFVDGHADQYAIGVMIFELLTGRLPYDPSVLEDPTRVMSEVANGKVHQLVEALPDAPARLVTAVTRMTALEPVRRFATMDRVGRALMPLASSRTMRRFRDLIDPGWSTAISLDDVLAAMKPAPALDGASMTSPAIDRDRVVLPLSTPPEPLPPPPVTEAETFDLGPPSIVTGVHGRLEDELVIELVREPKTIPRLQRPQLGVVTDAELVDPSVEPAEPPAVPLRPARRVKKRARRVADEVIPSPSPSAGLRRRAPMWLGLILGLGAAAWAALSYQL
jgi:serine/threonine protein kinase